MPVFTFRCECGNEFDKIVKNEKELWKWCKHCDNLTKWIEIRDPHSIYYKEVVCGDCMGNQNIVPVPPADGPKVEQTVVAICPSCGKEAPHVLAIATYGSTCTGPNMYCSSLGFRFNYQEP